MIEQNKEAIDTLATTLTKEDAINLSNEPYINHVMVGNSTDIRRSCCLRMRLASTNTNNQGTTNG